MSQPTLQCPLMTLFLPAVKSDILPTPLYRECCEISDHLDRWAMSEMKKISRDVPLAKYLTLPNLPAKTSYLRKQFDIPISWNYRDARALEFLKRAWVMHEEDGLFVGNSTRLQRESTSFKLRLPF